MAVPACCRLPYMARLCSNASKLAWQLGSFQAHHHQIGIARTMSTDTKYSFETLAVTQPREYVYHVEMNRPTKLNSMNKDFWREIIECFTQLAVDKDCRVVILSGAGKVFTAGLDLQLGSEIMLPEQKEEVGRLAFKLRNSVASMQESFTIIEKCSKPVVAAIHSACVGGGIDMTSACDIRLCTQDAYFVIKELDLGLAADLGTLQRFPKVIGNDSLARELVYTARNFTSDEAMQIGYVSRVFPEKESMMAGALDLATTISKKSPIAVQGSKVNLIYARDNPVKNSLDFQATWNAMMLQSEDVRKAVMAGFQKETAEFSKL